MHYLFMIKTTAAEIGALSLLHRLKELSSEKEKIKKPHKRKDKEKRFFLVALCTTEMEFSNNNETDYSHAKMEMFTCKGFVSESFLNAL